MSADLSFAVESVEAVALAVPLQTPLRNAFGLIPERPALVVRVRLADGATGLGEVFANFPVFSNRHKARLLTDLLAPLLAGKDFADPPAMTDALTGRTHAIALQSGEFGPFAHAIAGLDVAVWDAVARRADMPLHALLSPSAPHEVPCYASGLDGRDLKELVPPLREAGWRAFKLKVGFGEEEDRRALDLLRASAGDGASLMVDANQAFTVDVAEARIAALRDAGLTFVEEPIAADRPHEEWQRLAAIGVALAAGENLRGEEAFAGALDAGVAVVQPDAIKWGGLSGMLRIAAMASEAGRAWAPHYLAGGIGLAASAHAAAAAGAAFLEVDANPNPLRSSLLGDGVALSDGSVKLGDGPGHGGRLPQDVLERYRVA